MLHYILGIGLLFIDSLPESLILRLVCRSTLSKIVQEHLLVRVYYEQPVRL